MAIFAHARSNRRIDMCRSAAAAAAAGGYRGFLGAVVEAAAPRLGTFGGMLSRERYEGMRDRLECITRLDDMDLERSCQFKTRRKTDYFDTFWDFLSFAIR